MPDIKSLIDNPETANPERVDRELDLQDWDEQRGQQIAKQEGIELSDAHWEVVCCLQNYYLEHGPARHGRELSDMLDKAFADRGGRQYLRRLFPDGPVAQGMRIAGLPVPDYTENKAFGTSL